MDEWITESLILIGYIKKPLLRDVVLLPWGHTARMGQSLDQIGPMVLYYTQLMGLNSIASSWVPTVCQAQRDGLGLVAITPTQWDHPIFTVVTLPQAPSSKGTLDRQRCYWPSIWCTSPLLLSLPSPSSLTPISIWRLILPLCVQDVFAGQIPLPSQTNFHFPIYRVGPAPPFSVTGDTLAPGQAFSVKGGWSAVPLPPWLGLVALPSLHPGMFYHLQRLQIANTVPVKWRINSVLLKPLLFWISVTANQPYTLICTWARWKFLVV